MTNSAAELTDRQRSDFSDDGYIIVKGLFSPQECEDSLKLIEEAQFKLDLGEAADGPLVYRPMMHLLSPELQAIACDSRWQELVDPLVGDDEGSRLYWEQAVCKPPGARTELPWHQDNGYTPLIPEHYLTCWLALDDATLDNGCIWVIPGSHKGGTRSHRNDPNGSPFRIMDDMDDSAAIAVPISAGDVLVFSSLIMHRSGPNVSETQRRAWILQYCGATACSALSGRLLDDRLLISKSGDWLETPERQREFDLEAVLANYSQD